MTDGQKPFKRLGSRGQSPSDKRIRIPSRYRKCLTRHVIIQNKSTEVSSSSDWHPPVCQKYKSETGCIYGKKCRFRHVEAEEKPRKKSKRRWCGRITSPVEGVYTTGLCGSRFSSEKVYSTERKKIEIKSRRQILQGHVATNENSGKKRSIAENYSKVRTS